MWSQFISVCDVSVFRYKNGAQMAKTVAFEEIDKWANRSSQKTISNNQEHYGDYNMCGGPDCETDMCRFVKGRRHVSLHTLI